MRVKLKYAIKAKGRCDKDWEVLEIVDTMKDARDFVRLSSIQKPLIEYRIVKVK